MIKRTNIFADSTEANYDFILKSGMYRVIELLKKKPNIEVVIREKFPEFENLDDLSFGFEIQTNKQEKYSIKLLEVICSSLVFKTKNQISTNFEKKSIFSENEFKISIDFK